MGGGVSHKLVNVEVKARGMASERLYPHRCVSSLRHRTRKRCGRGVRCNPDGTISDELRIATSAAGCLLGDLGRAWLSKVCGGLVLCLNFGCGGYDTV